MTDRMTPWGTYLMFEVSSTEPDEEPVWVDFTDRVLDIGRDLETWLGRDAEMGEPKPGGMSVQLRNRDDALTPGNPTSPYHPWWKQGRRFRIREIIGHLGFDLADGYLEIPEVQVRTQDPDETDSDITLAVTAVDTLGRFQNARRFPSNLGAHIVGAASYASLGMYYPLTDPGPQAVSAGRVTLPPLKPELWLQGPPSQSLGTALLWQQDAPPGEDANLPRFVLTEQDTLVTGATFQPVTFPDPLTLLVQPDQCLTIAVWVRLNRFPAAAVTKQSTILDLSDIANPNTFVTMALAETSGGELRWDIQHQMDDGVTPPVLVDWFGDDLRCPVDTWTLVSLQIVLDNASGAQRLNVGRNTYTQTMGTAPAAFVTLNRLQDVGAGCNGGMGHLQVYITDSADDFDHLGQYEMGLYALERQTTGARISTILDLAGFPAGRRDIDPGVAVMQPVSLAGKRPLQALEEATETEQGRLFATGGRVVFHDRRRVLDV